MIGLKRGTVVLKAHSTHGTRRLRCLYHSCYAACYFNSSGIFL